MEQLFQKQRINMKKILLVMAAIFLVISCDGGKKSELAMYKDSVNTEFQKFQNVQDSILTNYSEAVKLINQIDDELNTISSYPKKEGETIDKEIIGKIDYLKQELASRNKELASLQAKLKSMSGTNKQLNERIKVLEDLIDQKNKSIANLQERISTLERQLGQAITERDVALEGKAQAEQETERVTEEKNTAYYIIGTEDYLKDTGVIQAKGKGFLGTGGKYIPNPNADLDKFDKINIVNNTELIFPDNSQIKEIVSGHDKKYLDIVPRSGNHQPRLRINNPEAFWKTDKHLIVIVERK